MKVLGLIPARAGSKGIPGKNLKPLVGKPLVQWTIEAAADSGILDRVVVSTDDDDVAQLARTLGVEVPFMRPQILARDESPMIDVVIHAVTELGREPYLPDAIAVLQPTSPLRRSEDIRRAIDMLEGADSVCSVIELPRELSPHYVMRIDDSGYLKHFMDDGDRYTRRQDVPPAYSREGTIYLVRREVALERRTLYGDRCVPLPIDAASSLSIDDADDWAEAKRRMSARRASG